MGTIWGKCCCKSGEAATEEDYYQGFSRKEAPGAIKGRVIEKAIGQENHRCWKGQFPVCDYCDKPTFKDEEKFGNCHKKPCYSKKTGRCCECNDRASKGIYCESCYDSKYPPPLRVEASWEGRTAKIYSRKEPSQQMIYYYMHRLNQKMPHRLTDGRPQFNAPNHNCWDSGQSPPHKAASSKKGAQKKDKGYIRELSFDELNRSSDRMWADQSPPRKAASSKKGAQKKGKGYKREETFDEVNCSSDRSCDSKYPPPATVGISTEGPNYNIQMQLNLEWILSPVFAIGRAVTSKLFGGWQ